MSRLPAAVQPAWPLVKRAHRYATRQVGSVTRRTTALAGPRAVPHSGTDSADDTVAREPQAVRMHLGGPAEELRRAVPAGTPDGHWVFRRRAAYDVPRRFTLEMSGGAVVGDYAAHITPGGVLDYETSTYFGVTGWREHPVYLRPRLPVASRVDGTLVSLATRGSAANYYHFLLDVLPRWGILREALPATEPDAVFVNTVRGYQRQLLELAGIGSVRDGRLETSYGAPLVVEPARDTSVRADRLLVPSLPNPDLMAPRWTTSWLRSVLPARSVTSRPRRLYVTRGNARNTRRLTNEAEVWPLLERRGFERIDPATLSVQEQVDAFAAAEAVVAPHGAALGNLVFCPPGVKVLELFAPRYVNPCYWVIADNVGADYRYLVCGRDDRPEGAPMNGVLSDVVAAPEALEQAVDALL